MRIKERLMSSGLIPATDIDESTFQSIMGLRDRDVNLPLRWEHFDALRKGSPWIARYLYLSTGFEPLVIVNTRIATIIAVGTTLDGRLPMTDGQVKRTIDSWGEDSHSLLWMHNHNLAAFEELSWALATSTSNAFKELAYSLIPWNRSKARILAHQRRCALTVRKCEEYPSPRFDASLRNLLRMSQPDKYMETSPSGPVHLWRGESSKSRRRGMSWTTDRDVALFFARRFSTLSDGSGILRECTVPAAHILASYAEDDEHEVLIDPRCKQVQQSRGERI